MTVLTRHTVLLIGIIAWCTSALAANARADTPSGKGKSIVLFSQSMCCNGRSWLALEETLRDEINATGLGVVVVDDSGSSMSSQLLDVVNRSARRGTLGGLRVYRQPASVELVLEYELQTALPGSPQANSQGRIFVPSQDEHPSLAALRATEALVAILIQQKLVPADFGQPAALVTEQEPTPPSAEPSPPVQEPSLPSMVLGLRIGAAFTTAEVGPKGAVGLSLGWLATPRLSLELEASTSFSGAALETEDSSSLFQYTAARLWTNWRAVDLHRFCLIGGIGAGVALPWVRGEKSDNFENSSSVTVSFYPSARFLLGWKIARALELALDSNAGLLVPRARIEVGDDTVTRVGKIIVESTLALRWLF